MRKTHLKKSTPTRVLVHLIVVLVLLFSACKKDGNTNINNNGGGKTDTPVAVSKYINAIANTNAAYNGFLKAFLVKSGSKTYFCDGLLKRDMAFMWQQAYMITMVEDAYDRSLGADRKQLIANLLDTFISQNGTDLSWDTWNDDIAWATIALVRGYNVTGNVNYLNAAKQAWNMAYNRGWDNRFDGGIWELMDDIPKGGSKVGLSNWSFIISGSFIYQATKEVTYLDKCKGIYAWARTHCYDAATGLTYEGWYPAGIGGDDNYYNSGLLVNAASSLYSITHDIMYYNDAVKAADHVLDGYGVLNINKAANGGFGADQVVRGISKLARENNLESKYYPWLVRQCIAAWDSRRTDNNITQNVWSVPTGPGDQLSMECMSAVTVQMVTPEAEMVKVPDGTYKVIARSTGQALGTAGNQSANNTALSIADYTGNDSQRWTLAGLGGGLYKLIGAGGKSVNVSGNSGGNNVPLILWDYNGDANEKVYFSSPANGYYTMYFVNSGRAVNITGSGKDASIVQSAYTGADNQQWQFKTP